MSIIKNINLTLKLGFTKISLNKNFPLFNSLRHTSLTHHCTRYIANWAK